MQFYSILFVSRMFAVFISISEIDYENLSVTDTVFKICMSSVLLLVSLIPLYLCLRRDTNINVINRASVISKPLAKIIAVMYILLFLYITVITSVWFSIFLKSSIFYNSNINLFIGMIIAGAAFCAFWGFETIGRTGFILACVSFALIFFMVVLVAPDFDVLNLAPPFYEGFKKPMIASVVEAGKFLGVSALGVILPSVKGKAVKGGLILIAFSFLVSGISNLIFGGVIGEFGKSQIFRFYTVTMLSHFSIFQQLNSALSSLWVLFAMLLIAYFIYLAVFVIRTTFVKRSMVRYNVIIAAVCYLLTIFFSANLQRSMYLITPEFMVGMFILMVIAVPLLVLILQTINERRKRRA